MDYYRARYYDPQNGRFLSEDPIRFKAGMNLYSYTRNSPVVLNDEFGYQACNATQWAQSPHACAGPQDPNAPYQGPDGLWYNVPEWHPSPLPAPSDPTPSVPSLATPTPAAAQQPAAPCKIEPHPRSPDCVAAYAETIIGGTAILGEIVLIWYVGPQLLEEGLAGGLHISHLGPALAPGVVLYWDGVLNIAKHCD